MMSPAVVAYIGLGSNLDDREALLRSAIRQLGEHPAIELEQCSSLYETDPVGFADQPPFLNMTARITTHLTPEQLLDICLSIEHALGRVREVRWGPRTIDLDLLLYAEVELNTPRVIIPHPRMQERLFVLIPLLEIFKGSEAVAVSYRKALETLEGKEGVRLWTKIDWPRESGHSAN